MGTTYYGTQARLSIKSAGGAWKDIGVASLVEIEMTPEDVAPYLAMVRTFEFTYTVRWIRVDRWAFALPPRDCIPMYN